MTDTSGAPRALTSTASRVTEALAAARALDAAASRVVAAADAWEAEWAKEPAARDRGIATNLKAAVRTWRDASTAYQTAHTAAGLL